MSSPSAAERGRVIAPLKQTSAMTLKFNDEAPTQRLDQLRKTQPRAGAVSEVCP
jgi:hypothetical protein